MAPETLLQAISDDVKDVVLPHGAHLRVVDLRKARPHRREDSVTVLVHRKKVAFYMPCLRYEGWPVDDPKDVKGYFAEFVKSGIKRFFPHG